MKHKRSKGRYAESEEQSVNSIDTESDKKNLQ